MIPWDATPKAFGDYCNDFCEMSEKEYDDLVQNNFDFVRKFDRKIVAQKYIDLAMGTLATKTGKYITDLNRNVDSIWCDHFGFTEKLNSYSTLEDLFS